MAAISAQLAEAREAHDAVQADLAAERQAHAATQGRLEAGRAELEAAGRQLAELCTQFSTELERAGEQGTLAQERMARCAGSSKVGGRLDVWFIESDSTVLCQPSLDATATGADGARG